MDIQLLLFVLCLYSTPAPLLFPPSFLTSDKLPPFFSLGFSIAESRNCTVFSERVHVPSPESVLLAIQVLYLWDQPCLTQRKGFKTHIYGNHHLVVSFYRQFIP